MRNVFLIGLIAALLAAAPAQASEDDESKSGKLRSEAEQALKEGTRKIMRALELMLKSVPQYDLPIVNEHGDIIIRRRNPDRPRSPEEPEEMDDT